MKFRVLIFLVLLVSSAAFADEKPWVRIQHEKVFEAPIKESVEFLRNTVSTDEGLENFQRELYRSSFSLGITEALRVAQADKKGEQDLTHWLIKKRAEISLTYLRRGETEDFFHHYLLYTQLASEFPEFMIKENLPSAENFRHKIIEEIKNEFKGRNYPPEIFAFYLEDPQVKEFLANDKMTTEGIISSFLRSDVLNLLKGDQRLKLFDYLCEQFISFAKNYTPGMSHSLYKFDRLIFTALKEPHLTMRMIGMINVAMHNSPEANLFFSDPPRGFSNLSRIVLQNELGLPLKNIDEIKEKLKTKDSQDAQYLWYLSTQLKAPDLQEIESNQSTQLDKKIRALASVARKKLERQNGEKWREHREANHDIYAQAVENERHPCVRYIRNFALNAADKFLGLPVFITVPTTIAGVTVAIGATVASPILGYQSLNQAQKDLLQVKDFTSARKSILRQECSNLDGTFSEMPVVPPNAAESVPYYSCAKAMILKKIDGLKTETFSNLLLPADGSEMRWKHPTTGEPLVVGIVYP